MLNSWFQSVSLGLSVAFRCVCISASQKLNWLAMTDAQCGCSGLGEPGHTVNNPTTCFGPQSHLSSNGGPEGTGTAASGATDTCWPLPSLPDWQMATPLDENDKWLSIARKDFLLTCDPWPWLLTPLRGWPALHHPFLRPLTHWLVTLSLAHSQVQVKREWSGTKPLLFLRREMD